MGDDPAVVCLAFRCSHAVRAVVLTGAGLLFTT